MHASSHNRNRKQDVGNSFGPQDYVGPCHNKVVGPDMARRQNTLLILNFESRALDWATFVITKSQNTFGKFWKVEKVHLVHQRLSSSSNFQLSGFGFYFQNFEHNYVLNSLDTMPQHNANM